VTRQARPEDIEAICLALPEVEFGTTWGDVPTYKVPRGDKGRGFLLYRPPAPTAIEIEPVASGDGRSTVPPAPAASCTR